MNERDVRNIAKMVYAALYFVAYVGGIVAAFLIGFKLMGVY